MTKINDTFAYLFGLQHDSFAQNFLIRLANRKNRSLKVNGTYKVFCLYIFCFVALSLNAVRELSLIGNSWVYFSKSKWTESFEWFDSKSKNVQSDATFESHSSSLSRSVIIKTCVLRYVYFCAYNNQ